MRKTLGEAKRKKKSLSASLLKDLQSWAFPASEWEANAVEEVKSLPVVKAFRPSDKELTWMRMLPQKCHTNAKLMEDNDPESRSEWLTGWWVQDGNYVLHSIINQLGNYICVTPTHLQTENPFDFIFDEKIEWREEGEVHEAHRDGVRINNGLRSDPQQALAELEKIREKLLAGDDPYKAFRK
jgi:hypothetical protein